jgi:glycosyltransferase involved in cell wall biosynthesis
VHFADASADVVRAAEAQTDVPVRLAVRDEIAPEQLGIAVAHAGVVLGSFRESRAIAPTVFDALSTGAPVITANTAAARELLVDGESALLVPPDDPGALADAVTRIAADDELRVRIAATGNRVFRERASRRALGARWAELLAPLV